MRIEDVATGMAVTVAGRPGVVSGIAANGLHVEVRFTAGPKSAPDKGWYAPSRLVPDLAAEGQARLDEKLAWGRR